MLDLLNGVDPADPGRPQHRDVHVPEADQADLHMGDPMTEYSNDALQASAHRHLWMHFTRMTGATPGHEIPVIIHGEGAWVYDQHGKRYLDGLSGLFTSQLGHGRMELAEAGAEQAAKLAYFPLWSYAHPKAIELAERIASLDPGRPQPRLLHHRRLRGGRVGVEAGPPVLQADRPAPALQGDQPRHRLPRRHHGRPVDHRRRPRSARRSSRWCPGAFKVPEHQLLPGPRTSRTTSRPSAAGPPTTSSRPSCSRTPRRWPPCSSSRCRTPAAASRRRPGTSSGCARSATATACCSCPTRSSAPSAGSATCSAPSATTTCPT